MASHRTSPTLTPALKRSSRSRVRYGVDIATLAGHFAEADSSDLTVDLLRHLALAWRAATLLNGQGVDFSIAQRKNGIVFPGIERAYREALHVRSRMPPSKLDVSDISKLGRINRGES